MNRELQQRSPVLEHRCVVESQPQCCSANSEDPYEEEPICTKCTKCTKSKSVDDYEDMPQPSGSSNSESCQPSSPPCSEPPLKRQKREGRGS